MRSARRSTHSRRANGPPVLAYDLGDFSLGRAVPRRQRASRLGRRHHDRHGFPRPQPDRQGAIRLMTPSCKWLADFGGMRPRLTRTGCSLGGGPPPRSTSAPTARLQPHARPDAKASPAGSPASAPQRSAIPQRPSTPQRSPPQHSAPPPLRSPSKAPTELSLADSTRAPD